MGAVTSTDNEYVPDANVDMYSQTIDDSTDWNEESVFDNFSARSFQFLSIKNPQSRITQMLKQFVLGEETHIPDWLTQTSLWESMSSGLTLRFDQPLSVQTNGPQAQEFTNAKDVVMDASFFAWAL